MLAQDRLIQCGQFRVALMVHILGVEPLGLVGLEAGARFRNALQREAVDRSCIEKISCSVPGFHPSSASMLMNASGK